MLADGSAKTLEKLNASINMFQSLYLRGLPGSRFMTFRWFATRGVEQGKQLGEAEGKLYYRAPINVTIVI